MGVFSMCAVVIGVNFVILTFSNFMVGGGGSIG